MHQTFTFSVFVHFASHVIEGKAKATPRQPISLKASYHPNLLAYPVLSDSYFNFDFPFYLLRDLAPLKEHVRSSSGDESQEAHLCSFY